MVKNRKKIFLWTCFGLKAYSKTGNPHWTQNLRKKFAHTLQFRHTQLLSGNNKQDINCHRFTWLVSEGISAVFWCWTHSGHHVQMLLRAAEVLGQVVHAEVFMLAGVKPGAVLLWVWDSVQEDPKRFPNRFLANWRQVISFCGLFLLTFSDNMRQYINIKDD